MKNITKHPVIKMLEEFIELNKISASDMWRLGIDLLNSPDDQFVRRTGIRTFGAHVEGVLHRMKQIALETAVVTKVEFTEGEVKKLKGEERKDFGENFRFTINIYARAFRTDFELPDRNNSPGRRSFNTVIGIRDRLMHPKTAADFHITDDETNHAVGAWEWFQSELGKLLNSTMKSFEAYANEAAHARQANPPL